MNPKAVTPPELIEQYRSAYVAANGKDSGLITYENGWYRFWPLGKPRFRRATIEQMMRRLNERHENKTLGKALVK